MTNKEYALCMCKAGVEFSWSYEDVGDRVITYPAININGLPDQDLELFDAGISITDARDIAKQYAKHTGSSFADITEKGMASSYRSELMRCYNRNR
jgi:hypothetical protein